jgi:putative drug exporter of the RND superfamily
VVFTSFVINTNPVVKMLAIGMAFAVLIDASLVRMCLVPSIMSLLGSHAWWMPRWMEPVVPQLHLEASPAAEAAPALAGTAGHPAQSPAGQSRPGPGPDDARRP